jgi:hypothetical protein
MCWQAFIVSHHTVVLAAGDIRKFNSVEEIE